MAFMGSEFDGSRTLTVECLIEWSAKKIEMKRCRHRDKGWHLPWHLRENDWVDNTCIAEERHRGEQQCVCMCVA